LYKADDAFLLSEPSFRCVCATLAARVRNATKSMQKAHNLASRLFNLCINDIAIIS
jgi:hypothetical protein